MKSMINSIMERSFDGLRIIVHIYFLILHYILFFNSVIEVNVDNISIPEKHLLRLSVVLSFMIFFVVSGITSGK